MSKFYGPIGFADTIETAPDVYRLEVVEKFYSGDILKEVKRWSSSDKVNDDLTISNRISIVMDPYAYDHFYSIRYAGINGIKWKVTSVEVSYPRLILDIGGVYNEQDGSQ